MISKRRFSVFLQFLVFGIVLGVVEDLLAVIWSTGEPFSWKMLVIVVAVAVPFAAIGEFIVDGTDLLPKKRRKMKFAKTLEVFIEFFVFGMVMGLAEDLLAVVLATGHSITWQVVGICALVTLPFAVLGEVVVDRLIPFFARHRK